VNSEAVSDRIVTIPNVVSFVRILGVGVFWWSLLVVENIGLSAVLIVLIGWTDWLDGYLARRLGQVSKLGKTLDPVADRLMIASAVIGGMIADVVPDAIGWPLIAREVLMGVMALYVAARGAPALEVRYLGKLATFLLYGAIPSFYFGAAGVLPWLANALGWVFGSIGLVIYWYVAFQYVGDARAALAALESTASSEES
jgi:cardiolipin synthase